MSTKTKIAAFAVAALVTTGGFAASTQQAQAGNGAAIGLGIAAGVLAGAAVANNAYGAPAYGYGYGYRQCGWTNRYDAYGYYMGRVRTCGW